MQIDMFVIRHQDSGSSHFFAQHVRPGVSVLNAGDGQHEHPTQAMLDMYTIRHYKKDFTGRVDLDWTLELAYYLEDAPWPASNRDFIYRQRLLHKDDKKIVFALNVEESDLMPEQDGIVRAEMIETTFRPKQILGF